MAWRVYAGIFDTADLVSPLVFQRFKPISKNIMIDRARVWLVGFNSPTFTSINAKIYADRNGVPGKLITTSLNVVTSTALATDLDNVVQPYYLTETFFEFTRIPLKATEFYHLSIQGTGYNYSDSSYLAWVKAWPDPVYRDGITSSNVSPQYNPYTLYFRGGKI